MFKKEFVESCILNAENEVDLIPIYNILSHDLDFNFPKKLELFTSIVPLLKFRKWNTIHFHLCKKFMRHIRLHNLSAYNHAFKELCEIRNHDSMMYKLYAYHTWLVYREGDYFEDALEYVQSEAFMDDRGFVMDLKLFLTTIEDVLAYPQVQECVYKITKKMLLTLLSNCLMDEFFEILKIFLGVGGAYDDGQVYVKKLLDANYVIMNETQRERVHNMMSISFPRERELEANGKAYKSR